MKNIFFFYKKWHIKIKIKLKIYDKQIEIEWVINSPFVSTPHPQAPPQNLPI